MDYISVGKIVNTHGIKGELRILSDFELKNQVFIIGKNIYIGDSFIKEEIASYRKHKEFDMITLKDYNNINQVLKYLRKQVYVKREDLNIDKYLMTDLIGFDVYLKEQKIGKIIDFVYNGSNKLLVVEGLKKFYIPMVEDFVNKVDINNCKVDVTDNVKGLIEWK